MKDPLRLLLALSIATSIIAARGSAAAHAKDAPPNLIVIFIDDLGYADIGPFGSKLNRTPHLDRMAAEGMKLTSFYAARNCSPSRASLMTGSYPKRVGIPEVLLPARPTGINAAERTLPELLKERGYATMCIGKWHLGDQPEFLPTRHGFDHYFGLPYSNDMGPSGDGARGVGKPRATAGKEHPPIPLLRDEKVVRRLLAKDQEEIVARYTDEALKFIQAHVDRPFFLYLPHTAVHAPIFPGPRFRGRSHHGAYSDWVEEVDWGVGQVLDAVRTLKLAERTLVLFTSDNGGTKRGVNAPLRGFKGETLEGGLREPTIAWWPGRVPAGSSSDAVTSTMDVLPTFVKLAGGKLPAGTKIDGGDLWPLLSGKSKTSPTEAFFYFKGMKLEAVRAGAFKLDLVGGKLYDLSRDPGEATDVAAQHAATVAKLKASAAAMAADLGADACGPGCRPPGRVASPQPIIGHDGRVRAGFE